MEEKKNYILKAETGKFSVSGGSVEGKIKRGEISWAYFPIAYTILLTISMGIIQIIEILTWYCRIILILLISSLWFNLCFFNGKFRTFIVGLFSKSKNFIEKF